MAEPSDQNTEAKSDPKIINRRRVPRRNFETPVGVLLHGAYSIERSFQVGEGGMMISSRTPIAIGTQVVSTFYLNSQLAVIVRGVVRSMTEPHPNLPLRYGIEFLNLGFQYKREIRTFVAAATRDTSRALGLKG